MKVALFLIGLLADHAEKERKDAERIERNWKEKYDEFEESLPEPADRTVEQWERLVYLTGERYYSMAALAGDHSFARHTSQLRDAIEEASKR